jgi:hypothetical protein
MERIIYGNLQGEGLEVVTRDGRYFLRYDAGAHAIAWREDEITEQEFSSIQLGGEAQYRAIIAMQRRLEQSGADPYRQNWSP